MEFKALYLVKNEQYTLDTNNQIASDIIRGEK